MKKLLAATLALAMGATIVGVVSGCDSTPSDADTAEKAIGIIRTLYSGVNEETATSYNVVGKVKVDDSIYDVDWTVTPDATCTVENFSNYVSLGELNTADDMYTVSISNAEVKIEYTLKASVTVGKATKSIEFKHSVPAGKDFTNQEVQKAKLDFSDTANRKSQDGNQQIWEQNGIKFTNDKATSSTDVANYANPVRLYKGSSVKIEYPGIAQIVFTSVQNYDDNPYVDRLKTDLEASLQGATVTADETTNTVTVVLATPVDDLSFTATSGQLRLYSIDVTGYVGGATDAQKVAAAKASLDIEKNYTALGEFDLPATQNGATVTWTVKGTSENVSIKDGKLSVDKMPATETEVTLTATITSGNETDTKDITISLVPIAGVTHAGTEEDPYTPSEAIAVAKLLEVGATSSTTIYVKGYVVKCTEYSTQYKNFDAIYIVDTYATDKDENSEDALYIFRAKPDGTYLTTAGFTKGDLVTFKGNLQNYKEDTQELVSGTCVAKEAAVLTDAQKVALALEAVNSTLADVTTTGEVTLPTSTIDGVTLSWSTENTTYTVTDNKLNVAALPAEDATVTLTVTATCGNVSTDNTKTVTVTIKAPAATVAATMSVAEANEILKNLASNETYKVDGVAKEVYVKGYVIDAGGTNDFGCTKVYIADTLDATKTDALYVYSTNWTDVFPKGSTLSIGDLIVVSGYLMDYSGTKEMSNATIDGTKVYPKITEVVTISVAKANEILTGLASNETYKVDGVAKEVYVKGYVIDAGGTNDFGCTKVYIADAADATKENALYVYSTNWTDVFPKGSTLAVGDFIVVTGYLMDYSGTKEMSNATVDGTKVYPKIVAILKAEEPEAPANVLSTLSFGSNVTRPDSEKISAYDKEWTAVRNDFTYTVYGFNNNNNGWSCIKTGRKNNAVVGKITTQKVESAVTKVVVTIDKVTDSSLVNSFKLKVYSDADLTQVVDTVELNIATGENTFNIAADKVGANYYYQIEIDCASGTNNGFVELSKVELIGEESAE